MDGLRRVLRMGLRINNSPTPARQPTQHRQTPRPVLVLLSPGSQIRFPFPLAEWPAHPPDELVVS